MDDANAEEFLQLPDSYGVAKKKLNGCQFSFRLATRTADEVKQWLADYSELTSTSWIVKRCYTNRKKFRKLFCCQHSFKNKNRSVPADEIAIDEKIKDGVLLPKKIGCNATIDIKLMSQSKDTVKKDKLRSEYPCFVTIIHDHNHDLKSTYTAAYLPLSESTKEDFRAMYNMGLTPATAIQHHRSTVSAHDPFNMLSPTNRKKRKVYHLYNIWRKSDDMTLELSDVNNVTDIAQQNGWQRNADSEASESHNDDNDSDGDHAAAVDNNDKAGSCSSLTAYPAAVSDICSRVAAKLQLTIAHLSNDTDTNMAFALISFEQSLNAMTSNTQLCNALYNFGDLQKGCGRNRTVTDYKAQQLATTPVDYEAQQVDHLNQSDNPDMHIIQIPFQSNTH